MAQNPGKKFEEDFFKSFPSLVDTSVDRVYDSMSGFKGHNTFCDFIVYRFPFQYYFELKSYEGSRIPMDAIRENQFEGLMNKAYIKGVTAGVILNFRISAELEVAYFIDIRKVNNLKAAGAKSIEIMDCHILGVKMEGKRKRTRFTYNVESFLDNLDTWRKEYG